MIFHISSYLHLFIISFLELTIKNLLLFDNKTFQIIASFLAHQSSRLLVHTLTTNMRSVRRYNMTLRKIHLHRYHSPNVVTHPKIVSLVANETPCNETKKKQNYESKYLSPLKLLIWR